MEQYIKQNLQILSIYELRTIARQVGVKSPTTKKHNELVECILKIQTGEEQAFSTKKGRPPKNINFVNQPIDCNKEEGALFDYTHAEESSINPYLLCDSEYVDGIYQTTYPCHGIVREANGKKYVYDYLSSKRFAYIDENKTLNKEIKKGDFIRGQAFEINPKSGILNYVKDINFNEEITYTALKKNKYYVNGLENKENIYNEIIEKDNNSIKIVLELETDDFGIVKMHDKCVFMYSSELEDIKRSYNAVLDCINLVNILSQANKEYSLYVIDIDYIYTILNAYLINCDARKEIDACQLIRQLFVSVKNSLGGELHIYEKANNKRNDYLEAMINKYLS